MKILDNNQGIALVTSLLLTLISLTMVMYLFSMMSSGVRQSAANKRYKTALDASYGYTDILLRDIFPKMMGSSLPATTITGSYGAINLSSSTDACLQQKLSLPPNQWSSTCSKTTDPKTAPDITVTLAATGNDSYKVYSKIVDTICSSSVPGKCTNSDTAIKDYLSDGSGTGGGTGGGGSGTMSKPATYRIEIRAEKSSNPNEKSNLSVLYAY